MNTAPHATRASYQRGCRCLPCRAANARYRPSQRHGTLVAAASARAHLCALEAHGIGIRQVAALAGVSMSRAHQVRSGAVDAVRSGTADKLLAVKPIPAKGALVPSWPCRRLLDQMRREGYSRLRLLELYKVPRQTEPGRPVRARTAARVLAVHRLMTTEQPDVDSPEAETCSQTEETCQTAP